MKKAINLTLTHLSALFASLGNYLLLFVLLHRNVNILNYIDLKYEKGKLSKPQLQCCSTSDMKIFAAPGHEVKGPAVGF